MKNELINVNIENREGKAVVSSRVVANGLNKKHFHVIRDLENILGEINPNLDLSNNIIISSYKDSLNRTKKEYLLTKDGFTLYMFNIQGYNEFKMAYINKFNEMERQLQEQRASYTIQDPIERAKAWIKEQEEKKLLETKLEEQQPKVQIADERLLKNGCYTITEINRSLGLKRGRLTKWAKEQGYIHKTITEVNESGRPYFKIYDNGGYKAIGITEEGLSKIQENLENIK